MTAVDRLAAYGHQLVDAVHQGATDDAAASLARLDRAELEHLVLLLAASVPGTTGPTVRDLVQERFAPPQHRGRH